MNAIVEIVQNMDEITHNEDEYVQHVKHEYVEGNVQAMEQ